MGYCRSSSRSNNNNDVLIIIVFVLLYVFNRLLLDSYSNDMIYWFMSCYFNDIVGSVAFMAYCNLCLSTIDKRIESVLFVVLLMMLCGVIFEYIAPMIRSDTVTDIYDFLAYIFGGFLYWFIDKFS